jgi:hypothetical protein
MDIPIDIASSIRKDWNNPISKSTVYTFSAKDYLVDDDGSMLFRFPFSHNTFWTQFQYSCINEYGFPTDNLDISVFLITSDEYRYTISPLQTRAQKEWYTIELPIPSIMTPGKSGIFIKIKPINSSSKHIMNIHLLGFQELFPIVKDYFLITNNNTYQFIFSQYNNGDYYSGSIFNVEHYDYIKESIPGSQLIELTHTY